MPEALLQRPHPPEMLLSRFLLALRKALENEGIRFCVLRNYEGFPDANLGNDIDLLICKSELPRAAKALQSIDNIHIVGYSEREFVANFFVNGVSSSPEFRSIQVDFFWNISYKGLPYLTPDAIFRETIQRRVGDLNFLVPSPTHEAIISLFASLLVGGWIKEKYFSKVQQAFASERSEVLAVLSQRFGLKQSTQLIDAVISGNRSKVLGSIKLLRMSFVLHSLSDSLLRSVTAIIRYYASEIVARYSPKYLETVCLYRPNSISHVALSETLMTMLHSSAQTVRKRPSMPRMLFECKSINTPLTINCNKIINWLSLLVKVVPCLIQEWICLFIGKANLTLRLDDRCDVHSLMSLDKSNYIKPALFSRSINRLFPAYDLSIYLIPCPNGFQSIDQENKSEEALSQLNTSRVFAKPQERHIIFDENKPLTEVTNVAYTAIINFLIQRTDEMLKKRFG
jgi:hypothetical protein